jgi:hypothetical protein
VDLEHRAEIITFIRMLDVQGIERPKFKADIKAIRGRYKLTQQLASLPRIFEITTNHRSISKFLEHFSNGPK